MLESLEGIVEEIIFSNEMNGYSVLELKTTEENIIVVGYLPFIGVGDSVKVSGNWVMHADYGKQLKAEYYEKILPHTPEALIRYLSSGAIKGIGVVTASRIINKFGSESVDVIKNYPTRLTEIKGISLDKAMSICNSFTEQESLSRVVMFFQEYGISPAYATKIYKALGDNTIEIIRQNPYVLIDKVYSIGFKTADSIAMKMGFELSSENRVQSGIRYCLTLASMEGHTYLPMDKLREETSKILGVTAQDIENAIIRLLVENRIYRERVGEEERIFIKYLHDAEIEVARRLLGICEYYTRGDRDYNTLIETVQNEEGITLAAMQEMAVKEALQNGAIVITGGPGTGKTTIIRSIIRLLQKEGLDVSLAAPTGRAAKRMSEATGMEAKTIHRLLEIGYAPEGEEPVFAKHQDNPLDTDVIIVDEMSMIDIVLMVSLLRAIPAGARLIMVGDVDQLPSVGPGNVLKDIINSDVVKTVRLTEVFRQAQESMIIVNAHSINNGIYPKLNEKDKDFFILQRRSIDDIVDTIVDLCNRRLPQSLNIDPMRHIQVLTPTRKIGAGVLTLNQKLQEVLNPKDKRKKEKASGGAVFREGDRVMQTRNNYNLRWQKADDEDINGTGVFNGDMGVISRIDLEEQTIEVLFDDDKLAWYDFAIIDELDLSYAITVHKSQGSEFPVVILPVFQVPPMLMTRNILYTAITRARSMVVLVGSEQALRQMVENKREFLRYSSLEEKLGEACVLLSNINLN